MTVREYIEQRAAGVYGKHLRIIKEGVSNPLPWYYYQNEIVKNVKVTSKYIFIYI